MIVTHLKNSEANTVNTLTANAFPRLIGDVGGTNARFGWQEHVGAPITQIKIYGAANFPSLQAVIETYLQELQKPAPPEAAIGIACPITGDYVQMTNHSWSFSTEQMKQAFQMQRLLILNDFTAQAFSIPSLTPADVLKIGIGEPVSGAPMAILGPGTGLGVSGLLPSAQQKWVPLTGEGGHVTLSPVTAEEAAVAEVLHQRFGHASAERAISGQGLENIYSALCVIDGDVSGGAAAISRSAADISALALSGQDARCVRALELMFSFLGTVAGNLALTLGALGGVYLVGGILPRMSEIFIRSSFRERFESKGRFSAYLSKIPTWMVITTTPPPALLGAARALDELR
jgi:glucokinase